MSKKESKEIPTFKPESFNQKMIRTKSSFLNKKKINDFFIHELSRDDYELKLPFHPHRKTVNDFIFLTKGNVTRTIFLDKYEVTENSIFAVKAGQIRSTEIITGNIEGYYCHFSNDFLASSHPYFRRRNFSEPLSFIKMPLIYIEDPIQLEAICKLLKRITAVYNEAYNKDLIQAYLITVLEELNSITNAKSVAKRNAAVVITEKFKKELSHKINKRHNMKYYANVLNASPNHLNKCVKQTTGKSASDLINEMIVLEAKVSLLQTDQSISEVAYHLGFDDPSYFGRFFKKHTGYKPSEFYKLIDISG